MIGGWMLLLLAVQEAAAQPKCVDPRVRVTLFASDPAIVTPIGIAVDGKGRILVVESHTHMPPDGYDGPKTDRIRVLVDEDEDGRMDRIWTFAEGFDDAMSICIAPDDTVLVCHRAGVTALKDVDGNGASDWREELVRLITKQTYAHSCLLGVTLSVDGWMYVSRGNTGGFEYRIQGSDGKSVAGYGDGGDIVRCRLDGTELQRVATGFWNPFAMDFDRYGRLLCVDNDPDSRGPNRLVDVIIGGNYGFRARFGPSGTHPLVAWNGELPGTLPYVSNTGEAPSGLLDASRTSLPADVRDGILVTSWGEHRIEWLQPEPRGASLRATPQSWITGGENFRPVGIAADAKGVVYVTDWVHKDYPNHGTGRIWRVECVAERHRSLPRPVEAAFETAPSLKRLRQIQSGQLTVDALWDAATDDDPFIASAARTQLAKHPDSVATRYTDKSVEVRRAAALIAREQEDNPRFTAANLLLAFRFDDPDPTIRQIALGWAADHLDSSAAQQLRAAIETRPVTAELFATYLAAHQAISKEARAAEAKRTPTFRIQRSFDARLVHEVLRDESLDKEITRLALGFVRDLDDIRVRDRVVQLTRDGDRQLASDAVLTLLDSGREDVLPVLATVAATADDPHLQADAVMAWAARTQDAKLLAELLQAGDSGVRREAVRAARHLRLDDKAMGLLRQIAENATDADEREQARFSLFATDPQVKVDRPRRLSKWQKIAGSGGDVAAGRRAFFDPRMQCGSCHTVHGRGGGGVGPDLSWIGRSIDRDRIVQSILEPSAEIAPEYMGHAIYANDGRVLTGLQFHFRSGGKSVSMIQTDGKEVRLELDEIETYAPLRSSLMPEDLVKEMMPADLQNLAAFLESLR